MEISYLERSSLYWDGATVSQQISFQWKTPHWVWLRVWIRLIEKHRGGRVFPFIQNTRTTLCFVILIYLEQCLVYQGLCPLRGRAFCRKISWSLEAVWLGIIMTVSLWILTGISAALLPRCLSSLRAIEKAKPESRGFETSWDLAVRRPSAWWLEAQIGTIQCADL